MQLTALLTTLSALLPLATANGIDPAFYRANFAPIQVARVQSYRTEHAGTLTAAQNNVLTDLLAVVTTQDRSRLPALRAEAIAAFGEDEALWVLQGRRYGSDNDPVVAARTLARRAPDCQCSTANGGWCGSSRWCSYGDQSCNDDWIGCGDAWLDPCDGMCVRK